MQDASHRSPSQDTTLVWGLCVPSVGFWKTVHLAYQWMLLVPLVDLWWIDFKQAVDDFRVPAGRFG